MATSDSHPECCPASTLHGQPLSKSSSSLLGDRPGNGQELRKSVSSTVCQSPAGEGDPSQLAGESSAGATVEREVQSTLRAGSHVLSPDQVPRPWQEKSSVFRSKSSTVGNVYSMGERELSPSSLGVPGAAVQRSHSDLASGCRHVSLNVPMEASVSCSALGSSSNGRSNLIPRNVFMHRPGIGPHDNVDPGNQPPFPDPEGSTDNVGGDLVSQDAEAGRDTVATLPASVVEVEIAGDSCRSDSIQDPGGRTQGSIPSCSVPMASGRIHTTSSPYCPRQAETSVRTSDTHSAYCHPLPIPALQVGPGMLCPMNEMGVPGCCHVLSTSEILTFPKLVSSVSESGLHNQHLVRYRRLADEAPVCIHCYAPNKCPQQESTAGSMLLVSQPATDPVTKTKDVSTMTSTGDLALGPLASLHCRDAEVQTAPSTACKAVATSPSPLKDQVPPHVFPEVNLEVSREEPKSPVREVRWDEEGMTWEVYGASVDPEVLGLAIQKHLEIQIEQFQTIPSKEGTQPGGEEALIKEGKRRPFRTMIQSLRRPSCCVHSSTAVE
ncbi:G protein-regulated inducer of neurite outgrowth 2 [Phascolarctos cinereus]|uniref:G protein-regulated inducer of neurite outgrowth 2 n=1 Tax=Phascolarctos cinereus TaxID=38626 RepID=A0A6P5L7C3_PHACI|nr:G protein-regulated inducer of neurite outgrowth 2 [Phascolarctos cinereus]XP_020852644.1 G protein-regulated inducer of neurite outgrowth 2 [Phascolarctos cinereus]XP_020852645.1 G protein-regulated inducer of neurite outgrowth 2 [Phascolarctos cinereus]